MGIDDLIDLKIARVVATPAAAMTVDVDGFLRTRSVKEETVETLLLVCTVGALAELAFVTRRLLRELRASLERLTLRDELPGLAAACLRGNWVANIILLFIVQGSPAS